MSRITPCLVALALSLTITPLVEAQSPEMPEPLAIVVDADGKPMVQVTAIVSDQIQVLFNFGGVLGVFNLYPDWGQFDNRNYVYFMDPDCEGDVYVSKNDVDNVARIQQQTFVIIGSDLTAGTYRVYRSTNYSTTSVSPSSWFSPDGSCFELGNTLDLLPAEEVLPNPLEGFHGPTLANPERLLTIKGGTRLP